MKGEGRREKAEGGRRKAEKAEKGEDILWDSQDLVLARCGTA
jgi:hypothetical protein